MNVELRDFNAPQRMTDDWWNDTSAGERVWEFITADVNLLEGQPWGTLMRNKLTGATRFRTYPDTIPARKIPLRRKYRGQR